ncbi:DNA-binding NarL/FixJ family response regulator [Curtobacterium luteum]|uniref:DNA-binding NarL/FixJ family response regulator n=1 Tax=Curtobacterium luteum TaxID=33881 RepID=A0A8H9G7C1_9MICO|nr:MULTISPECIES: response regulator transcription factor [Curtobacterium]MBM7801266.1 DNA-binding NarL/FixJ family response regulator [Curtobacterium luteum]NUU51184.1 response regulator transcription factor [Curtobacterium luteum]GGK95574.1 DNA-binding response regulator [Curtobacterium luteum]
MTTTPNPEARIRVALVDDQALFRTGIRMLIDSQSDLQFVGEAGDGAEGVELVRRARPDVVLMDVRMPVMDGITATATIVEQSGTDGAKVLVLTTFDFDEAAAKAIRAGASGFVLKDADPEFLLAAIRTVHAGTAVFAASATRELLRRYEDTSAPSVTVPSAFAELTPREREIFDLAAKGLSNSEIASHEFVSEATVKTHISRVLTKLELRDRVRLVVFAHEHGLVTKD